MKTRGEGLPKRVKPHNIVYAVGVALVVLINLISWKSVSFSDWYIDNVFPVWLNSYARLTSLAPISVGEVMIVLGVLATLILAVMLVMNTVFGKKFKWFQFRKYYVFYSWLFLVVAFVMTLNCFVLYHASSFEDKYLAGQDETQMLVVSTSTDAAAQVAYYGDGDETERVYTRKELATLRDYIVEKCNVLSLEIDHDDLGEAYYDGDLIEASRQAMVKLGEEYDRLSGYYVTPKYLSCSNFFSQQYIMGYYFPFSMEANINSVMYVTNIAPTVCHELAHTKGFIYEDDANMIGFLACINSDDKFLQYCGYLSVLNYVNNNFYDSIDKSATVYQKHVRISDVVADDNIFLTRENWQTVEQKAVVKTSTVKKVSNTLMDTSLKLNGVDEGILQYNGVVGELLKYYDGELY
jgi:hypothetical protein